MSEVQHAPHRVVASAIVVKQRGCGMQADQEITGSGHYLMLRCHGLVWPVRCHGRAEEHHHQDPCLCGKAVNSADLRSRLEQLGPEPPTASIEDFTAFIKSELAKWAKVVTDAGIPTQ